MIENILDEIKNNAAQLTIELERIEDSEAKTIVEALKNSQVTKLISLGLNYLTTNLQKRKLFLMA